MRWMIDLWTGLRDVGRVFVARWQRQTLEDLSAANARQLDALLRAMPRPMAPYLTPEQEAQVRSNWRGDA